MRDLFESVHIYLWVVLHHRWIAFVGALLICIIGWTVVSVLPDKFKVETKVFFDTKTVLKPLLQGLAVDNTIREESAMIMKRTLLSRPNLMEIAQNTDLGLKATTPEQEDALINTLKTNIKVSTSSITGKRRDNSAIYKISYVDEDPKLAKQVVDELLTIFVEKILGKSRRDSDKAEDFFDQQIALYDKKLEEAEERLKLFKQNNRGLMPEEGHSYYARINLLQERLEEAKLILKERSNKNTSLKGQVDELKQSSLSKLTVPDVTGEKSPVDERIENLETQLDNLLLNYTEQHPDVVALKQAITQLQQERLTQTENKPIEPLDVIDNESIESNLYQEFSVMLGESDADIAAIETRVKEYQGRIDEMKASINKIPEVEAKMARLDRDYNIIKKTYDQLVERRTSARLSREAEQTSDKLQFNVIEPPTLPLNPISPNRFLLVSAVFLIAIVAGAGLALLYEQIKATFYTRVQLEDDLGLPVVGGVSMYWSESELTKRRKGMIVYGIVSLGLICAYAYLMFHYF